MHIIFTMRNKFFKDFIFGFTAGISVMLGMLVVGWLLI